MAEPVTVIVSVDTEEDDSTPVPNRVAMENVRDLSRLDGFLQGTGARATYFTTYRIAATPWAAEIVRGLASNGRAEVGAHLHPWNTPPIAPTTASHTTVLANLAPAAQRAKIETLTDELTYAIGVRPRSFRAGRWGLNAGTVDALIACGYRIDSSVTPFQSWTEDYGPSHVGAPLDVYRLGGTADHRTPAQAGPLVEVPVSSGYLQRHWGLAAQLNRAFDAAPLRLRGVRPLASKLHLFNPVVLNPELDAVEDMATLARRLLDRGVRHLHMTFHSRTLRPGLTPFTQTAADVERFYQRFAAILERIHAMASVRFATVAEAAALLAPPLDVAATAVRAARATTPKRVLVTSFHFPPDPAIGGMRWAGLTKYLANEGWSSSVLTAAPATNGASAGVAVTSLPRITTLNDRYLRIRARASRPDTGGASGSSRTPLFTRPWLARVRYEVAILLSLPDDARGWILRAAWATAQHIRREQPSVIVSSGPPHSAHVAVWLATRFTRTPWIVDLRDPWAGPITDGWASTPFARSGMARWLTKSLERLVLPAATTIICNTREFRAALAVRYPTARIEWVPNAVDRALLPDVTGPLFNGLAIVHVGTIYGGRNVGPVLAALRLFLERHPDARFDGTALRLAGSVEDPYATELHRQIAELGLAAQVELLGMVPRARALELVGRSHIAIVLAQHQEFQVPGKLYEMVAMGVRTVVLATVESAAGREAARLGAAVIDPEDIEGLVKVMEDARFLRRPTSPASQGEVDYGGLAPRVSGILLDAAVTVSRV